MVFFHPTEISPNHPAIQQLFIPSIISSSKYPTSFHPIYYFLIQLSNNFSSHLVFLHAAIQQFFFPSIISSSSYSKNNSSHLLFLHPTIQQPFIPYIFSIQLFNNFSSHYMFPSNNLIFSSNYIFHPIIQLFLIQLCFSSNYSKIFFPTYLTISSSNSQIIFFVWPSNDFLHSIIQLHFYIQPSNHWTIFIWTFKFFFHSTI
jgi:hypothetical protein